MCFIREIDALFVRTVGDSGKHFSLVVSSSVPFLVQTCLKELEHPLVSVPESLGGESMPLRRVNVRVTFRLPESTIEKAEARCTPEYSCLYPRGG